MMLPKPRPHALVKAKRKRQAAKTGASVKAQVVARDGFRCRKCSVPDYGAEMMGWPTWLDCHEIKPRSLGGKRTTDNCIAVCRICHDNLTAHIVAVVGTDANGPLQFRRVR